MKARRFVRPTGIRFPRRDGRIIARRDWRVSPLALCTAAHAQLAHILGAGYFLMTQKEAYFIGTLEARGNVNLLRRQLLQLPLAAAALPTSACFAWAQAYPTRAVRIIVPYGPGGNGDVLR